MSDPDPEPDLSRSPHASAKLSSSRSRRRTASGHAIWFLVRASVAAVAVVLIALGVRSVVPSARWPWTPSPPRITHDMVVTQIQDVAKLVSTELTLRDVVTFEQTRLGIPRRALYVVTGKVLAGIDLSKNVNVAIDDDAKRIDITLPRAEILGVEVLNTRTYDETSTIFFRFTPEDRDRMQAQIREQLKTTAAQSGLLAQADRSARLFLESFLAKDGYTVKVTTRTDLATPPTGMLPSSGRIVEG